MQVMRHLRLFGAIRLHAESLHASRALRIKPNIFAIAIIFRTIIQPESSREASFVTARCRDCVNVIRAVAFGTVRKRFSVRRDSMQIAWRKGRHQSRFAAIKINLVNAGKAVFFGVVAHVNAAAIWVKNVVVIAVVHIMTFDFCHLACRKRILKNAAIAIVREERSVSAPVRRFNHAVEFLENLCFASFDIEHLQNRLVAVTIPRFTWRNFKRVTHAKLLANLVHERHEFHRFGMSHFRALPNNLF